MTKHNKITDKLKSSKIRKILVTNTKIMHKKNNRNCQQILEAISIKKSKKTTINKITFKTAINILNIFNN